METKTASIQKRIVSAIKRRRITFLVNLDEELTRFVFFMLDLHKIELSSLGTLYRVTFGNK